ncbi:hypothetical protein EJB05_03161, partial [Eragrostis curvula]
MAPPPTERSPAAASQQARRQGPGEPLRSHAEASKKTEAEVAKTPAKNAEAMAPPRTEKSPAAASQQARLQGLGAPVPSHAEAAKKEEAEVVKTPAKNDDAAPAVAPSPTEGSPAAASQQAHRQGPGAPVQTHAKNPASKEARKEEAEAAPTMAPPPTAGSPAAASLQVRFKGPEAPVQQQVEVATLRARVAAMAKQLQELILLIPGLRRLIAFLTGSIAGDLQQPAAEKKPEKEESPHENQRKKDKDPPRRRGGLSKLYTRKITGNNRRRSPTPSPPSSPPGRPFPPPIALHCSDAHGNIGIPCGMDKCFVRVDKEEELNRHEHFCHDLPAGWWRNYHLEMLLQKEFDFGT